MLGNIMLKVVEMSLVGCYSVVIVLVARGLLWKCERKYSYYLWFVVFLNLSLPLAVGSVNFYMSKIVSTPVKSRVQRL